MPLYDCTLLCSHLILIYLSYPATYSTVIGQSQVPFSDWSKCIPAARSKARGVGFQIQLDTQMYRLCIVYILLIAVCLLLNCTVVCSSQDYIQGPRIIDSSKCFPFLFSPVNFILLPVISLYFLIA